MAAYRVEWPAWVDWYDSNDSPNRYQQPNLMGGGLLDGTPTLGNYTEWQFVVAAGTYTVTCIYYTGTTAGIWQLKIDGTDIGTTTDGYTAGPTYNNVKTVTGVALTEGVHTLRITSSTKNASSMQYNPWPQWFSLERTGA